MLTAAESLVGRTGIDPLFTQVAEIQRTCRVRMMTSKSGRTDMVAVEISDGGNVAIVTADQDGAGRLDGWQVAQRPEMAWFDEEAYIQAAKTAALKAREEAKQ